MSIFIALGSNLGDKKENLEEALRLLKKKGDNRLQGFRFYCDGTVWRDRPARFF